ncbi:MAG: hypothetical protein RLZZ324_491 [Candidatus Parcubacteria bacterium]|jgi:putative endonuclease
MPRANAREAAKPMRAKDALGIAGELIAERHLAAAGLRILGRRVRTAAGEIDLIALDGREVVFIEVKTRSSAAFGAPEEAVTRDKRARLRRSAQAWLRSVGRAEVAYRIDVVGVVCPWGGEARVTHIKDAVEED